MTISIFLADDHPIVRRGLRGLLEAEPEFSVVGEAGDGLEAVELVERLQPDVLVLDLMMPSLSGVEVLRITRQRSPDTRVVVLSFYSTNAFVAEALRNGATGYVLKGCTEENLLLAIREAAARRRFLSPLVTAVALDAYIQRAKSGALEPHETLTPREREVLQMAAEGKTNAEIGKRLHISTRTVENHRTNLMHKLGLHNQSELIRHALRQGLMPLDD
jgi:two-component system, NarL family, response regulator NreC